MNEPPHIHTTPAPHPHTVRPHLHLSLRHMICLFVPLYIYICIVICIYHLPTLRGPTPYSLYNLNLYLYAI